MSDLNTISVTRSGHRYKPDDLEAVSTTRSGRIYNGKKIERKIESQNINVVLDELGVFLNQLGCLILKPKNITVSSICYDNCTHVCMLTSVNGEAAAELNRDQIRKLIELADNIIGEENVHVPVALGRSHFIHETYVF